MIETESLESFETPEQMRYRFDHCTLPKSPAFDVIAQKISTQVSAGEDIHDLNLTTLSAADLHSLFSMIGAVGVSAFIELGLCTCASSDDLRAIASLTHARHGLLLSNLEFFSLAPHVA